jgi:hypothetical protein
VQMGGTTRCRSVQIPFVHVLVTMHHSEQQPTEAVVLPTLAWHCSCKWNAGVYDQAFLLCLLRPCR